MRPEFDRQFDSLLRDHARRGGPAPRDGVAGDGRAGGREFITSAAHLDADELSAFAENALPASARARHTAHLADCGDCRQLVSQLSLAAGVADEIERREPSHAVGLAAAAVPSQSRPAWRERLATLFRPGAWRYAMPLAALLVASAAVLLLLSGRRRAELGNLAGGIDQARPSQSRPAELHHTADQAQQPSLAPSASQNTAANTAGAVGSTAEVAPSSDVSKLEDMNKITAPAPVGGVGGSQVTPAELAKVAPVGAAPPPATFAAQPQATVMPTPEPPPQSRDQIATASQSAPAKSDDGKTAEAKEKDRYDERNASRARKQSGHGPMRNMDNHQLAINRQADESRAEAAPKSAANSSRKPDNDSSRAGRSAAAPAARAGGEKREEKSGDDREDEGARGGETRSVGGRRFRRQGDAWVDTAYASSQATVRVSRGSEQYRSLVGDEPAIGRIANALGGEVVVVWKGRAYRIR